MSTPCDASLDEEPGITICPDCGEDLEWQVCGRKTTLGPAIEPTIRRVVEKHDALCLDVKTERERLIRALCAALTSATGAV